jgi:pimeloyl-ACP methyl ester carboxylesterase
MATAVQTGTTPAGTAYTVYEQTNGVDIVQWAVADSEKNKSGLHAVMYLHGSGGDYNSFLTINVFAALRNGIIDNKGVWAQARGSKTSVVFGKDHWNRDFAKVAYSEAAQIVAANLDVVDWIPLGRSMGGLTGKYLAVMDPYVAPRTLGYVDMSGIYSIIDEFNGRLTPGQTGFVKGNHFDFTGRYNTPDPPGWDDGDSDTWVHPDKTSAAFLASRQALSDATPTNDPKRYPQSAWAGKQVLVVYGTSDPIAVPPITALSFWDDIKGVVGDSSKLVPVPGATHSQVGGTFDAPAVLEFMLLLWGIVTPTFELAYKIDAIYLPRPDGLHLITPVPV